MNYTFKSDEILDWRDSENLVKEKDGSDKKWGMSVRSCWRLSYVSDPPH